VLLLGLGKLSLTRESFFLFSVLLFKFTPLAVKLLQVFELLQTRLIIIVAFKETTVI
jgi:hypothetical protein